MVNFKELNIKPVYRTGTDDLYNDFYKPVLTYSSSYDRAVGYFSSELLAMSIKGLSRLIQSNGKMRLIIGHPLDKDEFEAVQHGHFLKELVNNLAGKLERILMEESEELKRLELLALLIANGNLEVKFALRKAGMYHEKIGIFRDEADNSIVYQGSANETPHGMIASLNAESISVFKSWDEQVFEAYGRAYVEGFDKLWQNQEINTITVDVPSETYQKIANGLKDSGKLFTGLAEIEDAVEISESNLQNSQPYIPDVIGSRAFKIYAHQRNALASWKSNSFKGILKLATGSGKTITSIYGAVKIYEAKKAQKQQLFLLVAVPYIELATQWIANLRLFGINAYECFDSKHSWYEPFKNKVSYFNAGADDFCAAVVVNRTLTSRHFQSLVSTIDPNSLMVIGDECHNHGSKNVNDCLPKAYYRMGLSATPFRSDEDEVDSPFPNEAKERLITYYGEIVATYDLSDAINDGVLTPYQYNIIPIYLTLGEQELYEELSNKITKIVLKLRGGGLTKQDRENLTIFCGQRSRLLGSAQNKLVKLKELTSTIQDKDKKHTLFYAGEGKPFSESDVQDKSIIDQVSKVLNENGWRTSQFTGNVSKAERKSLMNAFKDKTLDALVAMKVLDEGIDVPACKVAYILASTRNPRQYIQRRGRILRKSEGKTLAVINDFVVLPIMDSLASKNLKLAEAERINDFALLAENKQEIEHLIEEHGLSYDVNT